MAVTNQDDVTLVAAALSGGPEAFAPIVERYQDAVFGIAVARLRRFHEAEDVAQQVFVEAFERLGSLKAPARLGAWLRSVTIHRCIDALRSRPHNTEVQGADRRVSGALAPDVELERQELRDQVMAAIGRLNRPQRETTTLFYVNGYSLQEVATIQEVPLGTVKRRLHDAREKLKNEMLTMVEDVLKSESPKEDLGQRVFELLTERKQGPGWWWETLDEIRSIGADGVAGFVKVFGLPRWQTRRFAAQMLTSAGQTSERVIELLKQMLDDPNKKVRRHALHLLDLEVDVQRKRNEFLPLLIPLLADRSNSVRHWAAARFHDWAADIPLTVATEAMLQEQTPKTRKELKDLVRKIVEIQRDQK